MIKIVQHRSKALESIQEYAILNGIKMGNFARMLGYSPQYFSQCINGSRPMTERMKRVIYLLTKGEVNLIDNT